MAPLRFPLPPGTRGFTLIEMLIALAVVGLLSAIAIPSYQNYLLRAYRAEARTAAGLAVSPRNGAARYNISFAVNPTATSYTLQAVPTGRQTADTRCATLTLTHQQVRGETGTGTVEECWSR